MKVFRNILIGFVALILGYNIYLWSITFDSDNLKNLSNGKVQIIGHNGVGFHSWFPFKPYPSNSYASLSKALGYDGASGIEVDVHYTKDKKFVLFHDYVMKDKTNLNGCPDDFTLEELETTKYQLGAPFDWFHNENIIGLSTLIDSLQQSESFPQLHLDVRTWSDCGRSESNDVRVRDMAHGLITLLGSTGVALDKVLIISLSKPFLEQLKAMNNPYPVSYEIGEATQENINYCAAYPMYGITIKPRILTPEFSRKIHDAGLKVITFGAKSKSGNKKLLQLNPDIIQTDNIPALNDLLEN